MKRRTDPNQLDLFDMDTSAVEMTAESASRVIQFPVCQWASKVWSPKVERVATVLCKKTTEKSRERYWQDTIDTLASQLSRQGAGESDVLAEVYKFRHAVSAEMCRQEARGVN